MKPLFSSDGERVIGVKWDTDADSRSYGVPFQKELYDRLSPDQRRLVLNISVLGLATSLDTMVKFIASFREANAHYLTEVMLGIERVSEQYKNRDADNPVVGVAVPEG